MRRYADDFALRDTGLRTANNATNYRSHEHAYFDIGFNWQHTAGPP